MPPHKSEDYKLAAVNYYNQGASKHKTCEVFQCSIRSLSRWIEKVNITGNTQRKQREYISYKVKQKHVSDALIVLQQKQQMSIRALSAKMKEKHDDYNISSQRLGQVIRDNNITRKRTRIKHFPSTRRGVPTNMQGELNAFYNIVNQYPLDKIICLDETSVHQSMVHTYSRCKLGRLCIHRNSSNAVFKKYTLLLAVNSTEIVGWVLYEDGGTNIQRMKDFIAEQITNRYRNHLVIMDNAGSHRNTEVLNEVNKNNPRPKPRDEAKQKNYKDRIIRHGLLMCQTCKSLWNRDLNASLNICSIVKAHLDGNDRPEYLQRSKICSGATSASHTVYTRYAKTKHCEGETSTS